MKRISRGNWIRKAPVLSAVLLGGLARNASAQSFNVDLDIFLGPPESGNGAPSSSFGAAANQPGFWNRVRANHFGSTQLTDLSGVATSVSIVADGAIGSAAGFNQPVNADDYALLLNDVCNPEPSGSWTFNGLSNGLYRVITYASNPSLRVENNEVRVIGASIGNPIVVTGPMPGNSFVHAITHAEHIMSVINGTLRIEVRSLQFPSAAVNGFQLTLVPEPSGIATLTLCLFGFLRKRRKAHSDLS